MKLSEKQLAKYRTLINSSVTEFQGNHPNHVFARKKYCVTLNAGGEIRVLERVSDIIPIAKKQCNTISDIDRVVNQLESFINGV